MGGYKPFCSICNERIYDLTFSRSYCSRTCKLIARCRQVTSTWLANGEQRWTVLEVPGDEQNLERGGVLPNELVKICLFNGTFDTGTILLAGSRRYAVGGAVDSKQYLKRDNRTP